MIEQPPPDCPLCPRLVEYRQANQDANPRWFNAPVPSWGPVDAPFLVLGMAPGVRGANRTGRPFTGDHAGVLLYETLILHGLATGRYEARPDDGMELVRTRVINAVRCVPPANLPTPAEVRTCNRFLQDGTSGPAQPADRARTGHPGPRRGAAGLAACPSAGSSSSTGRSTRCLGGLVLADSYHVSRYNTNTGLLTTEMFQRGRRRGRATARRSGLAPARWRL